ncbi:DUF485 domain-containing protein [Mycetocola sp. 2940]|uniref:DUF485 domain-containing protein n=1 Tax=Mycetocola sp. 2940 TaxID=3156452 RepID=UPI00339B31C7
MTHDDAGTHVPSTAIDYIAIEESPAFVEHKRRHRSFVFPLTVAFLVWYFAYVLLADYAHEFMSIKVIGNINVGLLLGLSQFVTTFAITTWYVSFANRKLDPTAEKFRHELEEAERA